MGIKAKIIMCESSTIFDLSAYINASQWSFSQKFGNMKLLFVTFLNFLLGKTLSALPEKLLVYQNVTGIDDQSIWKIFKDQKLGKKPKSNNFGDKFQDCMIIPIRNFGILVQHPVETSLQSFGVPKN